MNINSEDQKHNIDRLFSTKSNEQCEDSTSKNDLIEEANFDHSDCIHRRCDSVYVLVGVFQNY